MTHQSSFKKIALSLFGLLLPLSISGAQIIAAILLMEALIRWVQNPSHDRSPVAIGILIYVVTGVLSAVLNQSTNFFEALSAQSSFLMFFLFAAAYEESEWKSLIFWFCVGSAIAGGIGVLQFISGGNLSPDLGLQSKFRLMENLPKGLLRYVCLHNGRAVGTRSHALTYAESFMPAFFFLFVWTVHQKVSLGLRWNRLWKEILSLGLVGLGILFSQGRGIWLACFAGFLVLVIHQSRKNRFILLVSVGLISAGLVSFSPALRGRFMSIFSSSSGTDGDQISKSIRFSVWSQSLEQIKENPFLGVGLKGVHLKVKDPYGESVGDWSETHNIFLQSALERGLVGCGIFLGILLMMFQRMRTAPVPWRSFFLANFIAFLVAGLTESWTHDKEISMIFWTIAGLTENITRGKRP